MCSLNLSAKVLPDSPIYSSSQSTLLHLNLQITSTILQDVIFVLGVHKEVLAGIASFEIHFNPMFSADVFVALTHALDVWDHYVRLVVNACLTCVFACLLLLFNAGPG